jgi:hypothetical protein
MRALPRVMLNFTSDHPRQNARLCQVVGFRPHIERYGRLSGLGGVTGRLGP